MKRRVLPAAKTSPSAAPTRKKKPQQPQPRPKRCSTQRQRRSRTVSRGKPTHPPRRVALKPPRRHRRPPRVKRKSRQKRPKSKSSSAASPVFYRPLPVLIHRRGADCFLAPRTFV